MVALLGPRQCGKTTMAKLFLQGVNGTYFDMEDPLVAETMSEPMSTLASLKGLVIIDEAQRNPELFPVLRVLADREASDTKFFILGSASPELSRQASESLAGRVEIIELGGFDLSEVGYENQQKIWERGGFPRSYLAESDEDSFEWRKQFVRTFVERDLAQLGFGVSTVAVARFWMMLTHYHGQNWNGNEIAASLGIATNTAFSYLNALEQTYMVRRLMPWHVNVGKRLVKAPKIYIRDTGLLHQLQNIRSSSDLMSHPKLGASWEGFVLEQIARKFSGENLYYYRIHSGSELDVYLPHLDLGIEIKRTDVPKITRSMRVVMEDLKLKNLWVLYPGEHFVSLDKGIEAIPLNKLHVS